MRKFSITAVALLALGLITFNSLAQDDNKPAEGPRPGQQAPNFTLSDQDGKSHTLADLKGKVVVLEWFNEECPFVVKQYREGHMNTLADRYEEKGVVWLAIDTTQMTSEDNKKISEKWKIDRPILNDSDGTVGKAYEAKNTPQMFIIDKEGKIAYNGAIDSIKSAKTEDIAKAENYVAKALDELLAGETVSTPETKPYGCVVKYGK